MEFLEQVAGILWGEWTFLGLLGAGIIFTVWTKFSQYISMTHGIAVIRGVYDDPDDPGAINHFQALAAALSATVGLGNIGGVALAIAAGGPGAMVWMWLTGVLGMSLKTVEITLSQMYRNVDDPDDPHGGAMWVVHKVVASRGGFWKIFGVAFAVFFCITLLISSITGGNMFQSWNVAELTNTYFGVPRIVTGIILAVLVGLVIVGGIKRIGSVAGRLVPFMCVLYVVAGLTVLVMHVGDIPGYFALIFKSAFAPSEATGAFLGGTMGWAFSQGLRRALFSNEAGQGSAPIAHAAAKTDEPSREGIIGGLGPFIDTLCICTLTGLVILSTGTWNRDPLQRFDTPPLVVPAYAFADTPLTLRDDAGQLRAGAWVYLAVQPPAVPPGAPEPSERLRGTLVEEGETWSVDWRRYNGPAAPSAAGQEVMLRGLAGEVDRPIGSIAALPEATRALDDSGVPLWSLLTAAQVIELTDENEYLWENIKEVFTVVLAAENSDISTKANPNHRNRLLGIASLDSHEAILRIEWESIASEVEPALDENTGLFRDYSGASLTAHAFDRQFPGLGKWLVTIAAWLFALSTMISWSYYGEQGMIYMLGQKSVLPYKLVYLAAIIYAAEWIVSTGDMEVIMDIGTGAMLWSNLPIVLVLGLLAIRDLNGYRRRLHAGEFERDKHKAPPITEVAEGKDVERE